MIDQPTIDRILDAAQIYDVVSDFVTLRKRGVNYVGLCPFHDDKTPSFYVSPAKGLCKCFACGKGGNAVHFIMEHEQMSYPEALKYLAKKYGIEIKERELSSEEKIAQGERESLFIVNNFARDYFQNILKNHVDGQSIGMAYFRSRGFLYDILNMPPAVRAITCIIPARYYVTLLQTLFLAGDIPSVIIPCCITLGVFAVVLMGIARMKAPKSLE